MSMKNMNLLKLGLVAAVAGSFGTASAETIDGTATANVLTPLVVTQTTALAYGDVYGSSTAGTVVVDELGAISTTGGAGASGGAHTQATFTITGDTGAKAITVTLTPGTAQLDEVAAAGNEMALSTFTNTVLPGNTGAGTVTFDVGATLEVNANQPAGAYSTATGVGAPYTVTVNYN